MIDFRLLESLVYIKKVPVDAAARAAFKKWETSNGKTWIPSRDEKQSRRLTLNYIRHELTNYDELLNAIDKKFPREAPQIKAEARRITFKKIAALYPSLIKECTAQLNNVWAA